MPFYPLYSHGTLDPQVRDLLKKISESNSEPLTSITVQQARDTFLERAWLGDQPDNVERKDVVVENSKTKITLRIYTPEGNAPFPILIYFHGGGFVLGTLDEFDPFCSTIANDASCIVISVDYRLAPEHKHPAAVEDAEAAIDWIGKNAGTINGDPSRIAVAGDSAGANLAAVSTIIARNNGFPYIKYQVLISPWVNCLNFETDSYRFFGEGLWLSKTNMCWYRDHYLQNSDQAKSYLASPILLDNMHGLPPALILTAEFDVLRDEGKGYADRLKNEGIPVHYVCYDGMLHDFVVLPGLFNKAKDAISLICSSLRHVFYNSDYSVYYRN